MTQPNLGLCYLVSYLKEKNFEVQFVDELVGENFFDKIKKTDIVGLSSSTPFISRAFQLAKKIKEKFNVPIVVGGPHASAVPELVLKNESIDYIVLGEGELPLLDIMEEKNSKNIKAIGYKDNGEIKINKGFNMINNIDSIPFPARDVLNMDFYLKQKDSFPGLDITATSIFTSRGCPYNCSFCAANVVRGRGIRYNSPDYVIKELQHVVEKYKPQGIFFGDDLFIVNKDRLFEICERIIKLGLNKKIVWTSNARSDTLDEETLKIIKEAGCVQLQIGFESGSQKILDYLKCKTIKVEQNKNAIELCKKFNIRVLGFFIIGNPNETEEDIRQTVNFIQNNPIDYVALFLATPYPGTQMWSEYLKMNNINLDEIDWDSFWYGHQGKPFFVEKGKEEKFMAMYKRISSNIALKNYSKKLLIKRIIKRPSFAAGMLFSYLSSKFKKNIY